MTNIIYVTYATHIEGTYEHLINNNYNIKLITLGFNDKWISYMDKLKKIYIYICQLSNDDIVVYLDGFDTIINNYPNSLLDNFNEYNCKVLFSKDSKSWGNYITNKMFGDKDIIANAGMYMGYVKELKIFFEYILQKEGLDDQILINYYINDFDFIKIDINNKIFKNLNYYEIFFNIKIDQLFYQKPGSITCNRVKRTIQDNSQFYIEEILLVTIVIICILHYFKLYYIIYVILIYLIYFIYFIKKS